MSTNGTVGSPEGKPRFKLSPELADGEHWVAVNTASQVADAVRTWADEGGDGGFTVEVVHMTDREVDALASI